MNYMEKVGQWLCVCIWLHDFIYHKVVFVLFIIQSKVPGKKSIITCYTVNVMYLNVDVRVMQKVSSSS